MRREKSSPWRRSCAIRRDKRRLHAEIIAAVHLADARSTDEPGNASETDPEREQLMLALE